MMNKELEQRMDCIQVKCCRHISRELNSFGSLVQCKCVEVACKLAVVADKLVVVVADRLVVVGADKLVVVAADKLVVVAGRLAELFDIAVL